MPLNDKGRPNQSPRTAAKRYYVTGRSQLRRTSSSQTMINEQIAPAHNQLAEVALNIDWTAVCGIVSSDIYLP